MAIGNLRPASGRDWTLLGLGAAGAGLVIALALPRYSIVPTHYGITFIKVDRWTGDVFQCSGVCRPVTDVSTPAQ
jgi:hypothetical protein